MSNWRSSLMAKASFCDLSKLRCSWGHNYNGGLGLGYKSVGDYSGVDFPRKASDGIQFTSIKSGVYGGCGLSVDGYVYLWSSATNYTPKKLDDNVYNEVCFVDIRTVIATPVQGNTVYLGIDGIEHEFARRYHSIKDDTYLIVALAENGNIYTIAAYSAASGIYFHEELLPGGDITAKEILFNESANTSRNGAIFAMGEDGTLYARGANLHGELGIGVTSDFEDSFLPIGDKKWSKLAVDIIHTYTTSANLTSGRCFGIDDNGYLYVWGRYPYRYIKEFLPDKPEYLATPTKISDHTWKDVLCSDKASGSSNFILIDSEGFIYGFGPSMGEIAKIGDNRWKKVCVTSNGFVGIDDNGYLYQFGRVNSGGRFYDVPTRLTTEKWEYLNCHVSYSKNIIHAITS